MIRRKFQTYLFILTLLCTLSGLLAACSFGSTPAPAEPTLAPVTPTPSPTATITPTPAPLAARVNQDGVLLVEYEAELKRYQDGLKTAQPTAAAPEAKKQQERVLNELIDQTLLAQGAASAGYKLEEAAFNERLKQAIAQAGGDGPFKEWLSRNAYSEDSFRLALRRSLAAAWMRDQIASQVPAQAEQVHARQILFNTQSDADRIAAKVKNGTDFASTALLYDPLTGGELGWFPKGYLLQPKIEEAAFALQANQVSAVIQTNLGFHLIQVIERQPSRPLSPDALRTLQHTAIQTWLAEQRAKGKIETLVS